MDHLNILPNSIFCFTSSGNELNFELSELELKICETWNAKRIQQFTLGRKCAKQALSKFNKYSFDLLRGKDGEPIWPNEIVGSISHSNHLIGAIVASKNHFKSIGLDIETIGRVKNRVWDTIFTKNEQEYLASLAPVKQKLIGTALFSMKESFYKLQFPITKEKLWFLDVEISEKNELFYLTVLKESSAKILLPKTIQMFYIQFEQEVITYCSC